MQHRQTWQALLGLRAIMSRLDTYRWVPSTARMAGSLLAREKSRFAASSCVAGAKHAWSWRISVSTPTDQLPFSWFRGVHTGAQQGPALHSPTGTSLEL